MVLKIKNSFSKLSHLKIHNKAADKNAYSKTVLLPQTKFPLRLENKKLIERDNYINNIAGFMGLYKWQREHLKGAEFILHDGPPYANGQPHMGHAINKILKDTINRYKIIEGRKVNYVPGWDCHGLPIEMKAISDSKGLPAVEIRKRARKFAMDTIEMQKKAFQSWGVIGDWENPYTTFGVEYVKNQLKQFYDLYQKKLIYRAVKPVYWSPSSRTALAEAELEYNNNHKSLATTVKVKVCQLFDVDKTNDSIYALLWTTTPWTLPSNQAVCFNPELSYSLAKNLENGDIYLIATELVEMTAKKLSCNFQILDTFSGEKLTNATYHHPFDSNKIQPFLPAKHATANKGTGLVHTAPAHGPDDFVVALNNKLPLVCLVDESGRFTSEAGQDLEGLSVLNEGTEKVLKILEDNIVHSENYIHSYPYDWRTKQPVILRASQQWFIDTGVIKDTAIRLLEDVDIIPKSNSDAHRRNFVDQLRKRPYWCISRQRSWGVPIPIFYNKQSGEPIINAQMVNHFSELLDKFGTDYWWTLPVEELFPKAMLNELNIRKEDLEKGQDILDIWFDSGLSWSQVLNGKIADVYLEGIDQFTGWFQSSLLTSAALTSRAPYKTLYVHGFALDEKGLKMSKSLGNVIEPKHITKGCKEMKPFGIDTLRWWIICHASNDSTVQVSNNVLQVSADEVQKIRSVLRFAIAALFDYKEEAPDYNSFLIIDKYMLHQLATFHEQITNLANDYRFNKLYSTVINFVTNSVSALYYNVIKDRLYCNSADDRTRRAAQFVLLQIFYVLSRNIAPIVPHLVEELYMHLPQKRSGLFFHNVKCNEVHGWLNPELNELMEDILFIKKDIHKRAEETNTANLAVCIKASKNRYDKLREFHQLSTTQQSELADIFQVSHVAIVESDQMDKYDLEINPSKRHVCKRCRKVTAEKEGIPCDRCFMVLENQGNLKQEVGV